MTPEISEFSYGFALTNEIVGWAPLSAAPVFPSLIEEGRVGGGYDVRLDMPGVPLYIQFKRADCMKRRNAREIRDFSLPLAFPFYRFKITESGKSNQHELLLELDSGENMVLYAAPRFHEIVEINTAWNANEVASRSIFVAPNEIGKLDADSHHVAYDDTHAFLCSEPQPIKFLTSASMVEKLQGRLSDDSRPFGEKITGLIEGLERAKKRAEERAAETAEEAAAPYQVGPMPLPGAIERIPQRPTRMLSEQERGLRELSDTAAKVFNAQLVIVQEAT